MDFRFGISYQITKIIQCSHKEAISLCRNGSVRIDKKIECNPRKIIGKTEEISLNETVIRPKIDLKYVLFHKPNHYECTGNRAIENSIYKILPTEFQDLFSLGRLDTNSEGLLLLTNDGTLYREMMNQEMDLEKEYLVHTHLPISKSLEESFTKPFLLGQRLTLPAQFFQLGNCSFRVILKEGINRQIRRICAKNENQVKQLIRIRFGKHQIGELKSGEWKEISGF